MDKDLATEKQNGTLHPAAKRALAEAEDRRNANDKPVIKHEVGGRGGRDPTRYGDWENNGITSDF